MIPSPSHQATRPRRLGLAALLAALAAGGTGLAASPAQAALTYVTDFAKTANIANNLNQAYPNTGFTAGGSTSGNPGASFIYNPYAFSPSTTQAGNDGISYNLLADGRGRDYAEFGTASFGNPTTLTVPVGLSGITDFAALVSAYNGVSISITFTGADGTTQSFSNVPIPDFNGGNSAVNDCTTANLCRQTVFSVNNQGAGGTGNSTNGAVNTYNLLQLKFDLSPALESQVLQSVTFSTNQYEGLLLGLTAVTADAPAAVPEPASAALLGLGLLGFGLLRRRPA